MREEGGNATDPDLGPGVLPEHMSEHFGQGTAEMVNRTFAEDVDRGILLMRHSARTFDRDIHDLLNPLTDHGRFLCRQFGERLDKGLKLRGYASPAERCMESAQQIIESHVTHGGEGGRTRPVEALGVFYALDQQKMWKGLSLAPSLPDYVGQWFAAEVPRDAMIPAQQAMKLLLMVLHEKLVTPMPGPSLDLCVSHDFTVFALRQAVGLEPLSGPTVEFLDGLLLFRRKDTKDGHAIMRSHHGGEVELDLTGG